LVTPRGFGWRAGNALVQGRGHTGIAHASKRRPIGLSTLRASDEVSKAQILAEELKTDLAQMFDLSYEPKWDLYAEDVLFTDPLNKFTGIQKYKDNIKMLKDSPLFTAGKMDLHEITVVDDTRVDTRWTLQMTFKPFPWQPRLLFTGTTKYIINEQSGLVVKHLDEWDSLSNNQPVSFEAILELVSQMLPDIAGLGARALRGNAADVAAYTVLRKFGDGIEVRRYGKQTRVITAPGEVYDKDSYEFASNLLLNYRGDALAAAENSAKRILPRTEPALQMDSGNSDSSLAYLLPPGAAPKPNAKELQVVEVGECLMAVGATRGFGTDRGRTEEGLEQQRDYLAEQVEKRGFQVNEKGKAFTLANFADGYEMWLNITPK